MEMTERAQSAIVVAVDDMFFAAKIRATGEALGVALRFARTAEQIVSAAREENTPMIIFDLHAQKFDPLTVARELKSDERLRHVPLLGFFSHVETELEKRARAAGIERVMPRSAFSKRLGEILKEAQGK